MRVLAIDPGERTGWAIGVIRPGSQPEFTVELRGVDPLRDFALKLDNLVDNVDIVVYEVFRLYANKAKALIGNDMQTSQLIGIIRYVCWKQQIKIASQGATIKRTALKTMPDKLKESLGDSSEQHDQDAVMHLWHYYWTNHYEVPEETQ